MRRYVQFSCSVMVYTDGKLKGTARAGWFGHVVVVVLYDVGTAFF